MAESPGRGGGPPVRGRPMPAGSRIGGCVLAGAIAAAPFLALLYGATAGLAVAALALLATAFLAAEAARAVGGSVRGRLVAAAAINGLLALVCLVALAVRLG